MLMIGKVWVSTFYRDVLTSNNAVLSTYRVRNMLFLP